MEFCGGSNRFVDLNLKMLEQNEITTHIRVPIIPGFNDTPEDVETIAKYSCGFSQITEIQLLPFHKLGAGKYTAFRSHIWCSKYRNTIFRNNGKLKKNSRQSILRKKKGMI